MKSPGPRILCTEDDADTREIINLILSNAGYKVTCVGGSEEALQLARSKLFALYLVDSWLPDLSGIELTRKIREFDPTTPILFFSGAAYDADQESAFRPVLRAIWSNRPAMTNWSLRFPD